MTITSASIQLNGRAVVVFELTDGAGQPLSVDALDSDPRFSLAAIEVDPDTGLSKYRSYLVQDVQGKTYVYQGATRQPALASAPQAGTDSGGTLEAVSTGVYRYTFGTAVPNDIELTATHTVGASATRNDRADVANAIFHWVPAGGPPEEWRAVVSNESCNTCHGPLQAHGGQRRDVTLCLLCHTDQTIDPESGNSVEMSELTHKIHSGNALTNKPYFIVGHSQSVHDYSGAVFPQDVRHCEACHDGGAQADYWRTKPSRVACGSCHDDIDFDTGENHSDGIPQRSDRDCVQCHRDTLVDEFDRSVPGSHVVPYESSVNPQLLLAITEVTGVTPGSQPSVRFTIADRNGAVDVATLDRVAMVFGGPTSDFSQYASLTIQGFGSIGGLTVNDVGDYTFEPEGYTIPADAEGTWSVGMEARTAATEVKPDDDEIRFGANNPVVNVDVVDGTLGGGSPVARREVIDEARCNVCHHDLIIHGNLRTEIPYCQICHNPRTTDESQRPGVDPATNPPASVDLKYLVHKVHTGEELTSDYTVYGFGGNPHNYNEVVYPGDRRDCQECHSAGTYFLPPEEDAISTVISVGGVPVPQLDAVLTPSMAACLACHDDSLAFDHARLNAAIAGPDDWSEACTVCHGEGKESAVSEVHSP